MGKATGGLLSPCWEQHSVVQSGLYTLLASLQPGEEFLISDSVMVDTHLRAETDASTWKSPEMSDASTEMELVR